MQEGDCFIVDPACEVNERGTRDKRTGLRWWIIADLELTEPVRWEMKLYLTPKTTGTAQNRLELTKEDKLTFFSPWKQGKKGSNKKKYNPYFVIDRIVLSDMMESLVRLDEGVMPKEIELVNDMDQDWIDDRSEPEVEFEQEMEQFHEQDLTDLRVIEWLHDLPADPEETILTIQDVDKDGIKYVSHDNTESNWVAPDGPLRLPQSKLDLLDFGRSTGTSMDIFVRGVGVGLTQSKNLITYKLKLARETGELETEVENAKKPLFGQTFASYFDLANHYSNNIVKRIATSYSKNLLAL